MSEHTQSSPLFEKNRRAFLMRKLHSLSGVVPVGGFMLFHLWTNAKATGGRESFDKAVEDIAHTPFVWALEWLVILLPLAFHTFYGIFIAVKGKPNIGKYTYSRNWMYMLQRASGMIAAIFIVLHLKDYWWQKFYNGLPEKDFYPKLCADLSSTSAGIPLFALLYVIGIAACSFHFANGLWGFCFSWGITVSRRSQQLAATVFGITGVLVFFLGLNTVVHFATGESVTGMVHRLISRDVQVTHGCKDMMLSER